MVKDKILSEDIIRLVCEGFGGKNFDRKNNLIAFNAEDKNIEAVINECSNTGLFAEKKVVILRNVKKLLKDAKLSLLDYLNNPNPDTCLVMINSDDKGEIEKIFLFEAKEPAEEAKQRKAIIEKNVKIFEVDDLTHTELVGWIRSKFDDYEISDDTIEHFLQFSNNSPDEILSEIEKLKTYCLESKEITKDSVNLCNGIDKDFNEMDFIKAVIQRDTDNALKIYEKISLKRDVEVYLVFLLTSTFTAIYKLYDPASARLNEWQRNKELKLWSDEQKALLPYYNKCRQSVSVDKIVNGIGYIFDTDKLLKSSGGDKKTIMINLINNMCSLN